MMSAAQAQMMDQKAMGNGNEVGNQHHMNHGGDENEAMMEEMGGDAEESRENYYEQMV